MTGKEILNEIGSLLWSIFPEEAHHIVLEGQFYRGHNQCGPVWYDSQDNRLGPSDYGPIADLVTQLRDLVLQLQKKQPFDQEPFTHISYTLTNDRKMDAQFAYIPEWDSWRNLFMKGVSQVPEEEAKLRSGFYETWKECRVRFEREPYTLPKM